MAFFKRKNKQADEAEKNENIAQSDITETPEEGEEKNYDLKKLILKTLNEKLKGTIYDDCVIMPHGYTVDVQIGRREEKEGIYIMSIIYIVKNDDFDEPLIDPVDAQGKTEEEAAKMAADIFYGGVWHPIDQSMTKTHPTHISVDYLQQHYDFDMYCQSVVRIGVKDKEPVLIMNTIREEIPKYLGSKKYYWIRVYLARFKDRKITEVRVNGSVCGQLSEKFKEYVDSWEDDGNFRCEKQYAIFVQREDDKCPFDKSLVVDAARQTIERMVKISNRDEYAEMAKNLEEVTEDKGLASEIRIFIPEIFAKLTLGYREGDSLFLITDDSQIEFKKTQLRSYYYLQQVILEYLSKRPPQEDVSNIVRNSVAFREMRKAMDQAKENGKEIKPSDLFVPGTSYKVGVDNYKVW